MGDCPFLFLCRPKFVKLCQKSFPKLRVPCLLVFFFAQGFHALPDTEVAGKVDDDNLRVETDALVWILLGVIRVMTEVHWKGEG